MNLIINSQKHPFHIVNPSPWPFFIAFWLPLVILQFVNFIHYSSFYSNKCFYGLKYLGICCLCISIISWFIDIIKEATFEGFHTLAVQRGLRYGFILFIISEIILFFSFFWAFFHSSLNPSIFIGNIWPPNGIHPLSTWNIPFLNTLILLSSGVTVTWSHIILIKKTPTDTTNKKIFFDNAVTGLVITLIYGCLFIFLQRYEYIHSNFTIADGIYGSTFFIITGLHGIHVLIGTIFLFVQLVRIKKYHLLQTHHLGLEIAIWYWHFVDIIWLFVFLIIYFWSNN